MDAFIETKLDLIKKSIKRIAAAQSTLESQINEIEYLIQQKDFEELEKDLAKTSFDKQFESSNEILEKLKINPHIYTIEEIKNMKPEEFRENQQTILKQFCEGKIH